MAIPIDDGRSGGPLAVGVHVYEFIPEEQAERSDPDVLLPHQLEDGRTYVLVMSNGSGLYRYNIGDVVRVRGFAMRTPCIEFLHRAGSTCSLTGEKLTEDQVTMAIGDVAKALDLRVVGFTLAPAKGGFPRYVAYVELGGDVDRKLLADVPRAARRCARAAQHRVRRQAQLRTARGARARARRSRQLRGATAAATRGWRERQPDQADASHPRSELRRSVRDPRAIPCVLAASSCGDCRSR
jgi:hypothetical protein